MSENNKIQRDFPIAVIGASAGGLKPLEAFFKTVPEDTNLCFIVIQHLAPDHKSLMDELLSRCTNLPIEVINRNSKLEAGKIFLNPPQKLVKLVHTHFELIDKDHSHLTFPINIALNSIGRICKDACAGIILSGTGSDGSEGIKTVKEYGGLTLVQDPNEAAFDGMPNSALRTKNVDKALPVGEMYQVLAGFFSSLQAVKENQEKELQDILQVIYRHNGIDFSGYKISTISRRIKRRMGIAGFQKAHLYLDHLRNSDNEIQALSKDLLIGVTRMFRDQEAFEYLDQEIIPTLLATGKQNKGLRIWVPACSTGEEAYSLALLLARARKKSGQFFPITIFATDLDNEAIKYASSRIFADSLVDDVPQDLLTEYFIPVKGGFSPVKAIREMIIFSAHNLLSDPPFSRLDFISCRNFLIYLENPNQEQVFQTFQYSLNKDGYLFLGVSEAPGTKIDGFEELSSRYKVYRNTRPKEMLERPSKLRSPLARKEHPDLTNVQPSNVEQYLPKPPGKDQQNKVRESLLLRFAPASAVFDEGYNVLYITGRATEYLQFRPGSISSNIVNLIPEDWAVSFEIAVNKVKKEEKGIRLNNMKWEYDEGTAALDLLIEPLTRSEDYHTYVVVFGEEKEYVTSDSQPAQELHPDEQNRIRLLENELKNTREDLNTTIEELESSNEELQAANEEMQSSNEELESVNEELYTVNAEYQNKVKELSDANKDIHNLLRSTNIAILFLDKELKIRHFTEPVKQMLRLSNEDEGKYLGNIQSDVAIAKYQHEVKNVQQSLHPYETTLQDGYGRSYFMKVSPYRHGENQFEGTVISLVDVTQLSKTEQRLSNRESDLQQAREKLLEQEQLQFLIAENASDLICLHDSAGYYNYVSSSVKDITGWNPDDLLGKSPYDFLHPEDQKLIKDDPGRQFFTNETEPVMYRFRQRNGQFVWLESTSKKAPEDFHSTSKVLSSSRDVSHRKNLEDRLMLFSRIVERSTNTIIVTDKNELTTYANPALKGLTGYTPDEMLGQIPGEMLQGENTDQQTVRHIKEKLAREESVEAEILNYNKQGNEYWTHLIIQPIYDSRGMLYGFFSVQSDITERKRYNQELKRLNNTLNARNKRLNELNKEMEQFTYVVGHDLKEPVNNIKGLTDILDEKLDPKFNEDERELFKLLEHSAERVGNLIDTLLNYSRTGTENEKITNFTLREVLKDAQKALFKKIKDNNATLNLPDREISIDGFYSSAVRLFQNLISNALKYRGEKDPVININAQDDENYLYVAVQDNGRGIDKENYEKIFQVFNKVNREKVSDSHGIGLAVCKKIANMHQGNITVDSKLHEGSTFTVSLSKNLNAT